MPRESLMEQTIAIKTAVSVNDIRELNKFTQAFMIVDEIYRLIQKPELIQATKKIDFRKKEYKEISGAHLSDLRLSSPLEIVIQVDNLWIGALSFIFVHYKDVKENIREITADIDTVLDGISGLTQDQIEKINIGVRLFCDQLLELSENELNGLLRKVKTARHRINYESIESISVTNGEN